MKLYIQQELFSITDKFSVKDEAGVEKYFIEGELSLRHRLHIKNSAGVELALISQKLLTFLPKFTITVNNSQIAEIVTKFSLIEPKYVIEGKINWEINGDCFRHNFNVIKDNVSIVSIHKQWMSWGDCYEIELTEGVDEITALAVVLAIDCVLDAGRHHAHH